MLHPLTREKLEQLIPAIATGPQYSYYWGKWRDLLNRLLISFVAVIVVLLFGQLLGEGAHALVLLLGAIAGLYWLWCPVYLASIRNAKARRFKYGGFWQGKVLEVYLTEELIGEEQTVNQRGELVVIENRERCINLILGDETGFEVEVQAPLKRIYKSIAPNRVAELLLLSNRGNLDRIELITDAYLPSLDLWVGHYPLLQRDVFKEVSSELGDYSRSNFRSRNRDIKRQR
jgi:uncharacterized membrane protein YobD (UPF0266 family)